MTQNIGSSLTQWVKEFPSQPAIIEAKTGREITFKQLEDESNLIGSGLLNCGMKSGDRILVMIPYGVDFVALTFGLFKSGAIPVLIDPGLGKKNFLQSIKQCRPDGIIATPLTQTMKYLFPSIFKSMRFSVTIGRNWFWGGLHLKQLKEKGEKKFAAEIMPEQQTAAILFTSGSTGPAKGVIYTHGMFSQQIKVMHEHFEIIPGEKDLPTFPLFGLFSTGMGMTSVIPDMDSARPAKVNPENIIKPIQKYSITSSFGSPALWNTVSLHCKNNQIKLPSLRRILIAGAPVSGEILKQFKTILNPSCKVHTPYGATEALPVTVIERREIVDETLEKSTKGEGTCVGKSIPGVEIKIIRILDEPISKWNESLQVSDGEPGEIIVKAPWITKSYFDLDEKTKLAKIPDGESFWHRMGDIGKWDDQKRLWFYGRKSHRVIIATETLFTIPCEAIFNQHPDVRRSALVGKGLGKLCEPIIIIEPYNMKKAMDRCETFTNELLMLAVSSPKTCLIKKVLFYPDFPVDIRHNAKIFREELAAWAANQ